MKKFEANGNILDILKKDTAVLLYFSSKNCSVCSVLKEKIEDKISKIFPKIEAYEIKSDENLQIATEFSILSFPTILVFFEAKEFRRYGRNISLSIFEDEVKRLYEMVFR